MISRNNFHRVSKLLVDRDGLHPEQAKQILCGSGLTLQAGKGVEDSPALQAALLTAANLANRCFFGNVRVAIQQNDIPLCMPFPSASTLAESLDLLGICRGNSLPNSQHITFGEASHHNGLVVRVDGWTASVEPNARRQRLGQGYNTLAGSVAGALAISEVFLSRTRVSVEATRREVGISLWRPDLDWRNAEGIGVPIEHLPGEAWFMGLGHLGQAMLWCMSQLPFSAPQRVNLVLNDFDRVESANESTGLLTFPKHLGQRKTRVCADWLSGVGFDPSIVERRFQGEMDLGSEEPSLAFCGFDHNGPRQELEDVGFALIAECGLGGRHDNFDELSCHMFPSSTISAADLWPIPIDDHGDEHIVLKNSFYREIKNEFGCGHMDLAGVSVAVPFVGVVAGALTLSQPIRLLNGGKTFSAIDTRLEDISFIRAIANDTRRIVITSQEALETA